MEKLTIEIFKTILAKAKNKSVAVVGDVMLDRFFWGHVSRISPEAPVPVVDVEDESFHLGGAANVANNLKSLGMNPILYGVIGKDFSGDKFIEIAEGSGINTKGLYRDPERPTTVKTRIIGNNQHIVRLDREHRNTISNTGADNIIDSIKNENNLTAIIFGDYNKGAISETMIFDIFNHASKLNIPVLVDPKFDNFFAYKNSAFFKPNKKEASTALNMEIKTQEDIYNAGKKLLEILKPDNLLMTLSAQGMMLFESNGNISSVPTIARYISDVSGAGDTAIATLAFALAGGATPTESAMLANFASGAVCEIPGVVPITVELLSDAIKSANNHFLNREVINNKK